MRSSYDEQDYHCLKSGSPIFVGMRSGFPLFAIDAGRASRPSYPQAQGRCSVGTSSPERKRAYRSKPFAYKSGSGGALRELYANRHRAISAGRMTPTSLFLISSIAGLPLLTYGFRIIDCFLERLIIITGIVSIPLTSILRNDAVRAKASDC